LRARIRTLQKESQRMKLFAALLLALLHGYAGAAQVNRCVDASGKVVGYASECPAGTKAEQTNIKNAPASAATPQKSLAERDADFRKRQMEKQEAGAKAEKKMAEAADQKRACEEARSYLKALRDRQPVTRTDPKTGERIYLSDSDYPNEIARAERGVSQTCM
jgi:hypothetical protein